VTENLVENGNHYLWLKINKLSPNIAAIYKAPDTNVNKFIKIYNNQIEQRKRSVVFGDFNLDLLNKDTNTKKYLETMNRCGYDTVNKITKKYSTRQTSATNTILDHVCTDIKNHAFSLSIIDSSLSDHRQMFTEISKLKVDSTKLRRYDALNYERLYRNAKETIKPNEDDDYKTLENQIIQIINRNKTTKTKVLNAPRSDWISKEILNAIYTRNLMYKQLKEGGGNIEDFKAL
jgi:hypothetical protein